MCTSRRKLLADHYSGGVARRAAQHCLQSLDVFCSFARHCLYFFLCQTCAARLHTSLLVGCSGNVGLSLPESKVASSLGMSLHMRWGGCGWWGCPSSGRKRQWQEHRCLVMLCHCCDCFTFFVGTFWHIAEFYWHGARNIVCLPWAGISDLPFKQVVRWRGLSFASCHQ